MADATWTEPGAHQVAADVWRIPLPLPNDGLRAVNVYALTDGDGVVLVDGGWALDASRQALQNALKGIDRDLGDIHEFLVTHVHRDHYTQAVAIRREVGTPVALGRGEQPSLAHIQSPQREAADRLGWLDRLGAGELATTLRKFGPGDIDRLNWADPDRWLDDGEQITLTSRTLRTVETPGHTRGHVVFHDVAAAVMFSGDHILPHITPSIGVEVPPARSPLADFLASLQRIRDLPDAQVLPAHGPVAPSTHQRVDELLAHHEQRLSAIASAVENGASTAWEVAHVIGWTRRGRNFTDLDLFNQTLAVGETSAHLTVLASRGWLVRTDVDRVVHFRRA